MKRLLAVLIATTLLFVGCKGNNNSDKTDSNEIMEDDYMKKENVEKNFGADEIKKYPQLQELKAGDEIAILHTNMGDIKIKLFRELAPKTVENFTKHIENKYYDNVIFHRVIKDFMIQGGDPDGTGMGGESIYGAGFEDEFVPNLINIRGALSMANTGQPMSNGNQFFIVQNSNVPQETMPQYEAYVDSSYVNDTWKKMYLNFGGTPHLDGHHTVFGQVVQGMDVVDKIANVETNEMDKPNEDVVIKSAEVIKFK